MRKWLIDSILRYMCDARYLLCAVSQPMLFLPKFVCKVLDYRCDSTCFLIIILLFMNKIYLEPIAKAQSLVAGVKAQADVLQKKGIVVDVERLQALCSSLEQAGAAQDAAEEALKEARAVAHNCLEELKACYSDSKSPIKQCFPPETWLSFGVPDKK